MKSYSSTEVIRILKNHGWRHHSTVGSHWHFVHKNQPGKVTVPHPRKDIPNGTLRNIFNQAGIKVGS
ncbi:type II toxin-antitoxin system HicA family toxin [bacterium]|nr:type II toxin-antitoxin system HicA family toxin [bacterium]